MPEWTEELEAQLDYYWNRTTLPDIKIAQLMGFFKEDGTPNRNVVVGKANRMGWIPRPSFEERELREEEYAIRLKGEQMNTRHELEEVSASVQSWVSLPIQDKCPWRIENTATGTERECGKDHLPGKPLCSEHMLEALQRQKARRNLHI